MGREVGPIGGLPPGQVVKAAGFVREPRAGASASLPFVALPVKIRGATGSMVDPVAVI